MRNDANGSLPCGFPVEDLAAYAAGAYRAARGASRGAPGGLPRVPCPAGRAARGRAEPAAGAGGGRGLGAASAARPADRSGGGTPPPASPARIWYARPRWQRTLLPGVPLKAALIAVVWAAVPDTGPRLAATGAVLAVGAVLLRPALASEP